MTFEEAKKLLNRCRKSELRDHAFGDAEVGFYLDERHVAEGYYGKDSSISILSEDQSGVTDTEFTGKEADELRNCGSSEKISRNDSTGPDTFKQGECLPGLTLEGVFKELTEGED